MFPLALLAVGIGIQAYSQYRATRAAAAQAAENARRAQMTADDALQRGEQKAGMVELAYSKREGAQLAAYGHAGVDTATGSAAKTISTTAMVGALDAQIQRNNAFREAWGYQLQASSYQGESSRLKDQSYWDLFGAVFGGAGRIAGMQGATPNTGTAG